MAGDPQKFPTLTADEMFRILDHDCRDRHLWALALYGLRRAEIAGKQIVAGTPQVEGEQAHAADARVAPARRPGHGLGPNS